MAVCLDYQSVYCRRENGTAIWWAQVIAASLLLVALSTRIWVKVQTTERGYRLAHEQQENIQLDMERRELDLQLSVLLRRDNLTKLAGEKLGLKPLNSKQTWKISEQ